PEEFRERYHQQFVDRLWMRGLLGVGALYVVGVAIYLVALQFLLLRTHSLETEMVSIGPRYTNAIQLKARLQVLKDRQDLKYAGLDSWETVAEKMPDTLTLDSMNFSDGHRLTLNGSVPLDQVQQLLDFHAAMRKAMLKGQQMFDPNRGENLNYHTINPGTYAWSFSLELKRAELP